MSLVSVNWNPSSRDLRGFRRAGLIASMVLALLLYTVKHVTLPWCGTIVSVGLFIWLSGLISPTLTRYIYVALMVVTLPIGMTVSFLVLALFYYGVITPLGLVFRLIGRDVLCRRFDREAKTYWIDHEQTQEPERYFHQF